MERTSSSRWLVRGRGLLCALAASSCAATGRPPVAAAPTAEPERTFAPSAPGASAYTTEPEPALAGDGFTRQIVAEIEAGRRKRGFSAVGRDGRLDRVALDIASAQRGCRATAPEVAEALLGHYGIPEAQPSLFMHCGNDGAEPIALGNVRAQLAAGAQPGWRRVGVGVARASGSWVAVIVFQEKDLDMERVPRVLPLGGKVVLKGRVHAGHGDVKIAVTPPRGAVMYSAVTARGDAFSARLDCSRGAGVYQVEVLGRASRDPRVLANFPLYCAVSPPERFAYTTVLVATSTDPVVLERRLAELVDRDRARAGLPPLLRDARVAAAARRHSEEMAATGVVTHVSPRTGGTVERLQAARLSPPPTVAAENVGSAASPEDAQQGFMASPGHRNNVLSPAVTHVGVGVAAGRAENGMVPLYFTQIFVGWGK